jgi:hypothetical protein
MATATAEMADTQAGDDSGNGNIPTDTLTGDGFDDEANRLTAFDEAAIEELLDRNRQSLILGDEVLAVKSLMLTRDSVREVGSKPRNLWGSYPLPTELGRISVRRGYYN